MRAKKIDLEFEQGSTYVKPIIWKPKGIPMPLADWTARMQVRRTVESTEVLLELSTENDRITLDDEGTISLIFEAADTSGVYWLSGVYDLKLIDPDGKVTTLAKGPLTLIEGCTKL